jgi:hypothetical protein
VKREKKKRNILIHLNALYLSFIHLFIIFSNLDAYFSFPYSLILNLQKRVKESERKEREKENRVTNKIICLTLLIKRENNQKKTTTSITNRRKFLKQQ